MRRSPADAHDYSTGCGGMARASPADSHDARLDAAVFAQESPAYVMLLNRMWWDWPARAQLMLMTLNGM